MWRGPKASSTPCAGGFAAKATAAPHAADWADAFRADWVLLDHYRLSPAEEVALKGRRRLAVLDDLADRPRPADLVINPGYGRLPGNYAGLVPDGARVLAGPQFALVRPEFAAHRDQASSLPALREAAKTDCNLRLHVDSHAMAELMSQADIAVGAGGGSVWERATLGLPTVTVTLADNQRPMARAMEQVGLTLAVDALAEDFEARLVAAVRRVVDDAALRRWLFEAPCHACDGLGAERVAEAMLS